MNTECPYCGSESAYHDGDSYVCPDCGEVWDDEDDGEFIVPDDDDDE